MSSSDHFTEQIAMLLQRVEPLRSDALELREPSKLLAAVLEQLRANVEHRLVAIEVLRAREMELASASAALEHQRRCNRYALLDAPFAFVRTDTEGLITELNSAAVNLLGADGTGSLDVQLTEFVEAADRDRWQGLVRLERTLATVRMHRVAASLWFRCRVHVSPERDASGTLVGHRWMLVDTTVEERADEAARLVAEADRKDMLLVKLGHEVRNALAPIQTAIVLWRTYGHELSPAQRRWSVEVVARQTDRLASVMDDLLNIVRAARGSS